MSRSRKKIPIVGNAGHSDKSGKRAANRSFRRATKIALVGLEEDMPLLREVSDTWNFPKDGKHYWDDERAFRK